MKRCYKCRVRKEDTEFHKNRTYKDGLEHNCKACRKVILHKYYIENKEYRKHRKQIKN